MTRIKFFIAIWFTGLLLIAGRLAAQVPDHLGLKTKTWDILGMKTTIKANPDGSTSVSFPPEVRALENKTVELPGYIIPVKAGQKHEYFMLSVLPVLQCQFCGQGDVPQMVFVWVTRPVAYTDNAIKVTGVFHLNNDDPQFVLKNATVEEMK